MNKWNGKQLWDMPILFDETIYFYKADEVADLARRGLIHLKAHRRQYSVNFHQEYMPQLDVLIAEFEQIEKGGAIAQCTSRD